MWSFLIFQEQGEMWLHVETEIILQLYIDLSYHR